MVWKKIKNSNRPECYLENILHSNL